VHAPATPKTLRTITEHQGTVDCRIAAARACRNGWCLPFPPRADQEARAIDQVHHRQVEGLREIDEAHQLLGSARRPGATVMHRSPAISATGQPPGARSP